MLLIDSETKEQLIKVGITNHVERRIREIQRQSGYQISVLSYTQATTIDSIKLEIELHRKLYGYKQLAKHDFAGKTECFNLAALPLLGILGQLSSEQIIAIQKISQCSSFPVQMKLPGL